MVKVTELGQATVDVQALKELHGSKPEKVSLTPVILTPVDGA